MKKTKTFGLEYLEENDLISSSVEKKRWEKVDQILSRLSQAVGNGVCEGWKLTPVEGGVVVTQGIGVVGGATCETKKPTKLLLPDDGSYKIYAVLNKEKKYSVNFSAFLDYTSSSHAVMLGEVVVSDGSITMGSNEKRDISKLNSSEIAEKNYIHSRSKLKCEVENFIDSFLVDGKIPADKIQGKLKISHDQIEDKGKLSHEEIDSILLNYSNQESRLIDVYMNNFLQYVIDEFTGDNADGNSKSLENILLVEAKDNEIILPKIKTSCFFVAIEGGNVKDFDLIVQDTKFKSGSIVRMVSIVEFNKIGVVSSGVKDGTKIAIMYS